MGVYKGNGVYNDSQVTEEYVREEIQENGKGVFYVEYNETSRQDIIDAIIAGKIVVLKETNPAGAINYATLFFKGVSYSLYFVHIESEKLFYIYELSISDVWSKTVKSVGLPSTTAADNEKVLTVNSSGEAAFNYLPAIKFGVDSPLSFKHDTQTENVIGFETRPADFGKVLTVLNDGSIGYLEQGKKIFGVESPLNFDETDAHLNIVFDTTSSIGMFLYARPAGEGGGVVWKYAAEEIEISYSGGVWSITNGKTWQDIISALNYNRPVYIKMNANTNDFYYLHLVRLFEESGVWKAWFERSAMLTDQSNNNYFHLQRVEINGSNSVTFNDYKPAYEP